MGHPKQDYSFALSEDSKLISAVSATKEHKYFCPYCKSPMILRRGSVRKAHFAHKSDASEKCSYDNYLHKTAEIRIKECFDTASEFNIIFSSKTTCNVTSCPVNMKNRCSWYAPKSVDIKKFYDTCSIEKGIDRFVADLILTSSTHPNREPIIIEIFVTHKSSQEKIDSGFRIIEIKIASEEDIENIVESRSIEEKIVHKSEWSDGVDMVKFYNFRGEREDIPLPQYQHPKYYFWIDNKLYFHAPGPEFYNNCLERQPQAFTRELESSIFRIEASQWISLDFAFSELLKSGLNIKYCNMCKFYKYNDWYGRSMCILYKSKGTEMYPRLSYANFCPNFILKQFDLDNINKDFSYRIYIGNDDLKEL